MRTNMATVLRDTIEVAVRIEFATSPNPFEPNSMKTAPMQIAKKAMKTGRPVAKEPSSSPSRIRRVSAQLMSLTSQPRR